MADSNFIKQRIAVYAGKEIDPSADLQVKDVLNNLGIKIPQRSNLDDALKSTNEEHEIIELIIRYRKLKRLMT